MVGWARGERWGWVWWVSGGGFWWVAALGGERVKGVAGRLWGFYTLIIITRLLYLQKKRNRFVVVLFKK